jgi:type VII secretion protein EccB
MQNRRDLLQAHRLMTRRAALALLQGEPDAPDQPLRRLNVGLVSSVLVAVIVAAVFGVWGLLAPGDAQGLTAPGTLIMDSETGTSYIWCENGKLCPVVNYASARLALGTASPDQRTVTQASLARYPRGPLIGIPGLPQPLPDARMLVGQPWSVCAQTVSNPATLQPGIVTTLVGGQKVGGRPLAGGSALLVNSAGQDWLLWSGERLRIPPAVQPNVLTALGAVLQPAQVPATWLNAFPEGSAFAPMQIAGFGRTVRGPGGGTAHIGQVFTTRPAAGGAGAYYVLLNAGLAPVTPAQAALLDAARGQLPQATVAPSAVADDAAPGSSMSAGGLPQRMPSLAGYDPAAPLCVVYSGQASARAAGGQLTVGGARRAACRLAGAAASARSFSRPGQPRWRGWCQARPGPETWQPPSGVIFDSAAGAPGLAGESVPGVVPANGTAGVGLAATGDTGVGDAAGFRGTFPMTGVGAGGPGQDEAGEGRQYWTNHRG